MSELPKSWVLAKLGEFAYVKNGYAFKSKDYLTADDNTVPVIRISDIQNEKADTVKASHVHKDNAQPDFSIEMDDLLIAMSGATTGKTGVYKSKLIAYQNQRVGNIKLHSKLLGSNSYKNYLIASLSDEILKKAYGAAQPNISGKSIEDMFVAIAPLNEQNRIADKLDSILAKVDAAQARLDKIPNILKRFRQSVLAAATSGELTKEWRKTNATEDVNRLVDKVNSLKTGKLKVRKKKVADDLSKLPELPHNWAWIPNHKLALDKSTAICAGPFGTIFKAKDFRDKGVPIIFLRHVKELGFNQRKPNYMEPTVWEEFHQDYSVFGGELLVAKLGDPPGEACIYPEGIGKAMVTPDVLKMNVDTNITSPEYLRSFFNSPNCKDIIRDLAFGATRLRIDIPMFKGFPVPLPPFNEQKEIVRRTESLFTTANAVEKQFHDAKDKINRLTQSILAKAFRGELVAQDENDEPAEKLLSKIQNELKNKPKNETRRTTNTKSVVKNMKLEDAPVSYLKNLMLKDESEIQAKQLWKDSKMTIDDFYAQLKKELINIEEINESLDPEARTLKVSKE